MAENRSSQEIYKFDIITKVIRKEIKGGLAAKLLSVSPRQIRKLRTAVKREGATVLVHGLKGKEGNHHIDPILREKALIVIEEKYADFKPTFATEKLEENHTITLSPETTRLWMIKRELWKSRKQRSICNAYTNRELCVKYPMQNIYLWN